MAPTRRKKAKGLGDAIRERVAEQGVSLEKASRDLGLSSNLLQRWTDYIEPKADSYEVLMDYIGVRLEELGGLILVDQLRKWELKQQRP